MSVIHKKHYNQLQPLQFTRLPLNAQLKMRKWTVLCFNMIFIISRSHFQKAVYSPKEIGWVTEFYVLGLVPDFFIHKNRRPSEKKEYRKE